MAPPLYLLIAKQTHGIWIPSVLEEAIRDRIKKGGKPKAIIAVHLYGMPAKMNEIISIAKKFEIPVIEDAAEALGSSILGKKCGTFGELSILSFNGNKIITTSGGGALVSKKKADVKKAMFLATQARDPAPHYQHSEIGYNYRMSNICAGIGRGQMEVLTERINQRRSNYFFYEKELKIFVELLFWMKKQDFIVTDGLPLLWSIQKIPVVSRVKTFDQA